MEPAPEVNPAPPGQVNLTILQSSSLRDVPPSYSATMRFSVPLVPPRYDQTHLFLGHHAHLPPSTSFYHPPPPPSYAETEILRVTYTSSISIPWSRDPQLVNCAGCGSTGLTTIRENFTRHNHIACLMLFICGCWPCCIMPYFMNSCKEIHHHCSSCHRLLGVYNPWSRPQY